MKRLLVPCGFFFAFIATPVAATVLADWDLNDLATRADRVVIGVIGEQRSVRVDGRLMTETLIRVERTLHGQHRPTVVVTQLGGREGDRVSEVIGTAELIAGERMLLFTYGHADGRRYLVGMALGAFFVRDGGALSRRVNVPLLTRQGATRPPPGLQRLGLKDVEAALKTVGP